MKLSNNVKTKKSAPKLIFFNEKKNRKIRTIFGIENWQLQFLTMFTQLSARPKKKFFTMSTEFDKNISDWSYDCTDQKMPISDFQSQFSMSKIVRIFLFFFSLKNINLARSIFFVIDIFWKLELLKHFVY